MFDANGDGGSCTGLDLTGCLCASVGATRSCYTGPASTEGVGECRDGSQTCAEQGEFAVWGPCTGDQTPTAEMCSSGGDYNCNGLIGCDDPACGSTVGCCVPGATRSCYDGAPGTAGVGICKAGLQVCTPESTWGSTCPGEIVPGSEVGHCGDGLDNDCNGKVDCLDPSCATLADCCVPGATRSCYDGPPGTSGKGICMPGLQTCSALGTWPVTCDGEVLPGTETGNCSDGLDNDCNGFVDCLDPACSSGTECCVPGASRTCYDGPAGTAGVGICMAGQQICSAQGLWPVACAGEVLPGTEAGNCSDGLDNDCNGTVDCLDPSCSTQTACCVPGALRSCYTGPIGTAGVGICMSWASRCARRRACGRIPARARSCRAPNLAIAAMDWTMIAMARLIASIRPARAVRVAARRARAAPVMTAPPARSAWASASPGSRSARRKGPGRRFAAGKSCREPNQAIAATALTMIAMARPIAPIRPARRSSVAACRA